MYFLVIKQFLFRTTDVYSQSSSIFSTNRVCAVLVLGCSPGRTELWMNWLSLCEAPCVCVATPHVTKRVWSSLVSRTACQASPKPTCVF